MTTDLWLDLWMPLMVEPVGKGELLEIGCGWGRDTAALVDAGLNVYAIDQADLSKARESVAGETFQKIDLREFFPTTQGRYSVILASLSLHYFDWEETDRLVADIYEALQPEGLLIFRANSTKDFNFGASGYPEISRDFYAVENQTKRFFDEGDLARLFGVSWGRLSQSEMEIDCYERTKVFWEVVLKKKK